MIRAELATNNEPPKQENSEANREFKIGDFVIVKRSSGDFEAGWQITLIIEKAKAIVKKDNIIKIVSLEKLKTWNDENIWLPGQHVYLKQNDPIPWPGWIIKIIDKTNNRITIYNPEIDETREVSPDQLLKDFATPQNRNRYAPKKIIKK